jgi:adenosine kinase
MIMKDTGMGKGDLLKRTKAIISTLGEHGSLLHTTEKVVEIPAAKASQVKDPTGAGDAYRAGIIKGLVLGKDLEDAARMGATCASYAVECYGTQEHTFTQEEFWKRHEATFGES